MGYIYKITNTVTKKCYIGETNQHDYNRRWSKHINSVKYKEGCPLLKASMKKHGIDNFKFEILIICFDDDLEKYEREYIKKYDSQSPNGYNILSGGQLGNGMTGYKHTESTINKIKTGIKLFRESNPNHFETYREKHKESLDKIDISSLTKSSDKFQKALAENRVGAHRNGIGHSDKSKQKIRDTLKEYYKNNKQTPHTVNTLTTNKAIIQYDTDNNMVKEYISIAEAGRTSGVKKANIQHVLCGNTKSAGGFIWKYKSISKDISNPDSKEI
jgi:group I intron endonuclease